MTAAYIKVNYVGRHMIDWDPDGSPVDHSLSAPRTNPRYIDFISRSLEEAKINKKGLSPTKRGNLIRLTQAVLDRARDPQGRIIGLVVPEDDNSMSSPEDEDQIELVYDSFLRGHMSLLESATDPWGIGKTAAEDKPDADKLPCRDGADIKAQRDVPVMYNQRCVLTGTFKSEGAHIVPVRAKYADHDETWKALCTFWPYRRPADVTVQGQEHRNILPLTQTAHALFDAFYFALRPIAHPKTPSTRIFLQVVYLRNPNGQRIATHWDHGRFGGLCDFRRTPHPKSPAQHQHEPEHVCSVLQHGDVYEIVTDDPDSHPLPSERLLQVQYGLHQIMSGMRAAGGLRDIFGETPPLDDDGDSPCPIIPAIWQDLIQEAQDLGILDEDAAARWGRAFARQARQNAEDEEAYYADFRQSILDDDDISENNIVKRILRGESVNEHSREDDRSDNDQDRHGTGKSIEDREHDLR